MIPPEARPLLAAKVRLRFDRHSGKYLLLYPERGMELNASAGRIAELCTGALSLAQIVDQLHVEVAGATRERIEADVQAFLGALLQRGLLKLGSSQP